MALVIAADAATAAAPVKPKPLNLPSCAYVTFLAGNVDNVKGVVGLAKGLRKAKSKYPLVVAVMPGMPADHRNILVDQGCVVREIVPVYPREKQTQFARAYYVINYSKLRIWEFVEYNKMIYLDRDIQVFDNIDHLFDLPNGFFHAVMDCFCVHTWSHTPQFKIGNYQQCPDKVQWPDHVGPKPSLYFNAGMFVYEPNLDTYQHLLKTRKITPLTPFAEQDFLNMYFKDNLRLAMLLWHHPKSVELDEAKVVHYCAAGSKPWRYTGKEENMERDDIKMPVKKWWKIYGDESLDYKNIVARDEAAKQTKRDRFLEVHDVVAKPEGEHPVEADAGRDREMEQPAAAEVDTEAREPETELHANGDEITADNYTVQSPCEPVGDAMASGPGSSADSSADSQILAEGIDENAPLKEDAATEAPKPNELLLGRMEEDNRKMMGLLENILARNEQQTQLLNSLSQRVEQLERRAPLRRSKKKGSM